MVHKEGEFPFTVRKQVRQEQKNRCAWCGEVGCLQVHHVIPRCMGGVGKRENAVALCRDKCHPVFDRLALEHHIFFTQVVMEEGKKYPLPLPSRKRHGN